MVAAHRGLRVTAVVIALFTLSCGSKERALHAAQQGRASALATAQMTTDAWARGDLRPGFARLAFEAARQQVEQQRHSLAVKPQDVADPAVAGAIADLEHLSRQLAQLSEAARRSDVAAAQKVRSGLAQAEP
jgi:hypothetical protein